MPEDDKSLKVSFRISVCSRAELERHAASGITHILSIENPREPTETPPWFPGKHAHVVFQDVESLEEARQYGAVAPTAENIRSILDFGIECIEASKTRPTHLLVHCHAGGSRSPAAAFSILCLALGRDSEEEALTILLAAKPDAFPNKLVVELADQALDRNGRMLKALQPLRQQFGDAVSEWAKQMEKRKTV